MRVTSAVAVVLAGVCVVSGGALNGQEALRQDTAAQAAPNVRRPAVVRTTVAMVADHIRHIAGHRVLVVDGSVERVASPRVFILTARQLRSRVRAGDPDRVAVVLPSGAALADLETAAEVLVEGVAYTYEGARLGGVLAPQTDLPDDDLDDLRRLSIVAASTVETPGGVSVVR